jgi:hypothetical protein
METKNADLGSLIRAHTDFQVDQTHADTRLDAYLASESVGPGAPQIIADEKF